MLSIIMPSCARDISRRLRQMNQRFISAVRMGDQARGEEPVM